MRRPLPNPRSATAACQVSHAVPAARGQWVTNEKTLLDRAGFRDIDGVLTCLAPRPEVLAAAVDEAAALLEAAAAGTGGPGSV